MVKHRSDTAYVVDGNGRLLGLVTDYTVLKWSLAGKCRSQAASSLMLCDVKTIGADANVGTVLPLFRDAFRTRVAVIHDGCLIGELRRQDLLAGLPGITSAQPAPPEWPRPSGLRSQKTVRPVEAAGS